MKQLLRITHDESDYTYQIVNDSPITPLTTEIQIVLDGTKYVLVRDDRKVWTEKEGNQAIDSGLIQAIGRTVSLRFRIS